MVLNREINSRVLVVGHILKSVHFNLRMILLTKNKLHGLDLACKRDEFEGTDHLLLNDM